MTPRMTREVLNKHLGVILEQGPGNKISPCASLTDELLRRMQKAAGAKIDKECRDRIQGYLEKFERACILEKRKYGDSFRYVLGKLETNLGEVLDIADALDRISGHLWTFLTDIEHANVASARGRIARIHEHVRALNERVDASRGRKPPNFELFHLMSSLRREYEHLVQRPVRKKRMGSLKAFCTEAVSALPEEFRPTYKAMLTRERRERAAKTRGGSATRMQRGFWVGSTRAVTHRPPAREPFRPIKL